MPTFVYLLGIWFLFGFIGNFSLLQFNFTIYLLLKFSIIISGHRNMSRSGTINFHKFQAFIQGLFPQSLPLNEIFVEFQLSTYLLNLEAVCSNTFDQPLPKAKGLGWPIISSCEWN